MRRSIGFLELLVQQGNVHIYCCLYLRAQVMLHWCQEWESDADMDDDSGEIIFKTQDDESNESEATLPSTSGSRDGAVARALTSHHCGPGSIPGFGVICGLSLLYVFVGILVFPPSSKTNISEFQFDLEFDGHRFVSDTCTRLLTVTLAKQSRFIFLYLRRRTPDRA